MKYKILVAEDDRDIAEFIKLYLENEGYEVILAGDGLLAYEATLKEKIDLAVVDIMLPKMNGYDLIKKIREGSNIPIVILSAKNLDSDKILGLDLGADDYLTKPFNPLELIARIKSNIRRYYSLGSRVEGGDGKASHILKVGDLTLDEEEVTLRKGDAVITITPTEYKMMVLFMKSPGKVFTKMQIYQAVSGGSYVNDDNTLMVHISNLRDKIDDNPREPKYSKNIRGIGDKIETLAGKGQEPVRAPDQKLYHLYTGHCCPDDGHLFWKSISGKDDYTGSQGEQAFGRHRAA